jgi:hypothetical protein
MPIHIVQRGEGVTLLAERYGFAPETIWNDDANAALRRERDDMNVLMPGDEVTIPDKSPGDVGCRTGARHVFRRRGIPARHRLQILDHGEPVPDAPYRLTIDDVTFEGRTDRSGMIEQFVPPASRSGTLEVLLLYLRRIRRRIVFALAPLTELAGVQQRLSNLGYYGGDADGFLDDETRAAVAAFQRRNGLAESGESDEPTRAKLAALYGERGPEGMA